jgi:hypothetical protein
VVHLLEVGRRRQRPLLGVEILEHDLRRVRQQGTPPAPRPAGADRREGEQARGQRDDRPAGRQVVRGAARGRGHDQAVTGEALHALHAVDGHADVRRLHGVARDGDLVEGAGVEHVAGGADRGDGQRVHGDRRGRRDPRREVAEPVLVHQEPDRPAVHAEDRPAELELLVDRVQQQPVTAEGDDHRRLLRLDRPVAGHELGARGLRPLGARRHEGDPGFVSHADAIVEVTPDGCP